MGRRAEKGGGGMSGQREALVRSGYEVRDLRTYTMPAHLQTGVDDVKSIFFTWAQKKVGV